MEDATQTATEAASPDERVVILLQELADRINEADRIILLLMSGDDGMVVEGEKRSRMYMYKHADDKLPPEYGVAI